MRFRVDLRRAVLSYCCVTAVIAAVLFVYIRLGPDIDAKQLARLATVPDLSRIEITHAAIPAGPMSQLREKLPSVEIGTFEWCDVFDNDAEAQSAVQETH